MQEIGVNFYAALQEQRFKSICSLVKAKVIKTGDSAFARKQDEGKKDLVLCYHFSANSSIRRRFTMTNALVETNKKRRPGHFPGMTEYETSFSGCDIFNRRLKDKNWPHKHQSRTYEVQEMANSDYLFTVLLMNVQNLWIDKDKKNRKSVSFENFCTSLSLGLMEKSLE